MVPALVVTTIAILLILFSQARSQTTSLYGCALNANGLRNIEIGKSAGKKVSYRFRALYTGECNRVRLYLIFDDAEHVGYSSGTGGTILVQLMGDDGTENHNPSCIALAASLISDPMNAGAWNRLVVFDRTVALTAGRLYHIVFSNTDPDPIHNWTSLDNLYEGGSPNVQPGVSDTDQAVLKKDSPTSGWAIDYGATPIFCLSYTDGRVMGQGYIDSFVNSAPRIAGFSRVRETFTVSGRDVAVSRVSVRVRKAAGPGGLLVRLERSNGALIEEGAISASLVGPRYGWVTCVFGATHVLAAGSTYNLVLAANRGGDYRAAVLEEGVQYGFTGGLFTDGQYEYASGGPWQVFEDRDMSFYFTGAPAVSVRRPKRP
ncbi:MAG: hypothetical protein ABSC19_01690 [Syntrophorhabdales bacterium]